MRRRIWPSESTHGVCLLMVVYRFRPIVLGLDAILGEATIHQRRKRLEEGKRGKGLSEAYGAIITRLNAQRGDKSVLGLKVLMWVLHSERPLRAEELCHALGVEIGSADLHLEKVPAFPTLLACCLGLVTVEVSSSTVQLVHFTLREYLLSHPALFQNPKSTIAEVCLTYLNFRCLRDSSPTPDSAPPTMPFREYASCYWVKHARRGMTENVEKLGLRFLNRRATQFGLKPVVNPGPLSSCFSHHLRYTSSSPKTKEDYSRTLMPSAKKHVITCYKRRFAPRHPCFYPLPWFINSCGKTSARVESFFLFFGLILCCLLQVYLYEGITLFKTVEERFNKIGCFFPS